MAHSLSRHPALLDPARSLLVVVDMQDSLLNAIAGRDALVNNVSLLIRAARIMDVPILATTQNAPRLGPVAPVIAEALANEADIVPIDKLCFSCAQSPGFVEALTETGRKQIVVCGMETHICVSQTAHDLLHAGYQIHVPADAASSRTIEKHKLGMERIRDNGILPCASEAVVYEWLQEAGTPAFREVLKLVR